MWQSLDTHREILLLVVGPVPLMQELPHATCMNGVQLHAMSAIILEYIAVNQIATKRGKRTLCISCKNFEYQKQIKIMTAAT